MERASVIKVKEAQWSQTVAGAAARKAGTIMDVCTHRDWYEVTSSGEPGSALVGMVRTAAARGVGWRWESKCSKGRVGEARPLHARMPPRSTQSAPPHPAR